jgi:hypothetical protein
MTALHESYAVETVLHRVMQPINELAYNRVHTETSTHYSGDGIWNETMRSMCPSDETAKKILNRFLNPRSRVPRQSPVDSSLR